MLKTEDLVEDEYYSTLNNFNKKTVFICGNKQQTYKFWWNKHFTDGVFWWTLRDKGMKQRKLFLQHLIKKYS